MNKYCKFGKCDINSSACRICKHSTSGIKCNNGIIMNVHEIIMKHGKLDYQEYHVNLLGIRHEENVNKFNDELYILRFIKGVWEVRPIVGGFTTDPGSFWLKNPSNSLGTAILKEGFHENIWKLGKHQGKYKALVQANPCTVLRDKNKDLKLDKYVTQTGIFGINLHRANEKFRSVQVDKWSAGCQVVADPKEFQSLLGFVDTAIKHGQKYFSYTLVNSNDLLGGVIVS